jgi:hypothetical protein
MIYHSSEFQSGQTRSFGQVSARISGIPAEIGKYALFKV